MTDRQTVAALVCARHADARDAGAQNIESALGQHWAEIEENHRNYLKGGLKGTVSEMAAHGFVDHVLANVAASARDMSGIPAALAGAAAEALARLDLSAGDGEAEFSFVLPASRAASSAAASSQAQLSYVVSGSKPDFLSRAAAAKPGTTLPNHVLPSGAPFSITVRSMMVSGDGTAPVNVTIPMVTAATTVRTIKNRLRREYGVNADADNMTLYYKRNALDDARTLGSYGIVADAHLKLATTNDAAPARASAAAKPGPGMTLTALGLGAPFSITVRSAASDDAAPVNVTIPMMTAATTVLTIKNRLRREYGVNADADNMTLYYKRNALDDARTLGSYGIVADTKLKLTTWHESGVKPPKKGDIDNDVVSEPATLPSGAQFIITVRSTLVSDDGAARGRNFTIPMMTAATTVRTVKKRLRAIANIMASTSNVTLYYNNSVLDDARTLGSYGIVADATLKFKMAPIGRRSGAKPHGDSSSDSSSDDNSGDDSANGDNSASDNNGDVNEPRPATQFIITVRSAAGSAGAAPVNVTIPMMTQATTVRAVKDRLRARLGIKASAMTLYFNHSTLSDTRTLGSYGIVRDATLQLQTTSDAVPRSKRSASKPAACPKQDSDDDDDIAAVAAPAARPKQGSDDDGDDDADDVEEDGYEDAGAAELESEPCTVSATARDTGTSIFESWFAETRASLGLADDVQVLLVAPSNEVIRAHSLDTVWANNATAEAKADIMRGHVYVKGVAPSAVGKTGADGAKEFTLHSGAKVQVNNKAAEPYVTLEDGTRISGHALRTGKKISVMPINDVLT